MACPCHEEPARPSKAENRERATRSPFAAGGVGALSAGTARPAGAVRLDGVFGADRPVEIEIGFGKGLFLVNAGQSRPDLHFVGVEIVRKYQLFTATRLAKRGLA